MKESIHFLAMLQERAIHREWVKQTIEKPDQTEERIDGTKHFIKEIFENEGRKLRVVVNVTEKPNILVTAFFDRRLNNENRNR